MSRKLRNIAIIAHVDHGKTTLVDALLRQCKDFDPHKIKDDNHLIMDNNQLERERGITILSKNCSVTYQDYRINIVDTPGHADFGGEVERVLQMVDGILLLVDAYDGPMPQTRFVLQKALEKNLKPIVVINKIDRQDARISEVINLIYDLFIELGADDEQIEFPIIYTSAKDGAAFSELPEDIRSSVQTATIEPLFKAIIDHLPAPQVDENGNLQLLISNLQHDNYVGKLAIGRVERGTIRANSPVMLLSHEGDVRSKISTLMIYEGLERKSVESAAAGEIVCVSGIEEANIGDTIADPNCPEAIPFSQIDEPTISMVFSVNNSPFAGNEGDYVTARHLRDRLEREMKINVAMSMEETENTDTFVVKGRGELQLSILIETMRREGYEFQVSKPQVITREIAGKLHEPEDFLMIDVPETFTGTVIENLGRRKAQLLNILPPEKGFVRLEFRIPARGLIGYRSEFLTDTKGNGIINRVFNGFIPWQGEIAKRNRGALVAHESGTAMAYGIFHAQDRGEMFIKPGDKVYQGMIIGRTLADTEVIVNVCKTKHVTNMRASGSDEALRLIPPREMSLEELLDFVAVDEWLEITPLNLRLRKKILDHNQRKRLRGTSV